MLMELSGIRFEEFEILNPNLLALGKICLIILGSLIRAEGFLSKGEYYDRKRIDNFHSKSLFGR